MNNYSTRVFTFGPGSMESLTLRVWANRRDVEHLYARLEGSFTIYCGAGNDHTVAIKESTTTWMSENTDEARWMADSFRGVQGAADNLAAQLVEWAVEGWVDPCQEDE